jgi:hypothetical protein
VIERTWRGLVADCRAHGLAPDHTLQPQVTHQARDGATGDSKPSRFICRQTFRTP